MIWVGSVTVSVRSSIQLPWYCGEYEQSRKNLWSRYWTQWELLGCFGNSFEWLFCTYLGRRCPRSATWCGRHRLRLFYRRSLCRLSSCSYPQICPRYISAGCCSCPHRSPRLLLSFGDSQTATPFWFLALTAASFHYQPNINIRNQKSSIMRIHQRHLKSRISS